MTNDPGDGREDAGRHLPGFADPVLPGSTQPSDAVIDLGMASGLGAGQAGDGPPPETELRAALEAILLIVDEPVAPVSLAQVLERPTDEVLETLRQLQTDYDSAHRGFELRQTEGAWRLYTRPEYGGYVQRFIGHGHQARLSRPALETLAVIAYQQPVTRARIAAIRGVNVDGVVRTLLARGLVEEAGTEQESGAVLYRTTTFFLERMGLGSLTDLPSLGGFLPDHETFTDEID